MTQRHLSNEEQEALRTLVAGRRDRDRLLAAFDSATVEEVNDGGMGSLKFSSGGKFGVTAGELEFVDEDGVTGVIALLLDEHGNPLELDVWKVDFSALKKFPSVVACHEIRVPRTPGNRGAAAGLASAYKPKAH